MSESTTTDREFWMIAQLREALGMFVGAMPISPSEAWREAIVEVRDLRKRFHLLDEAPALHREESWQVGGHYERLVTDWRKVKKTQDV